MKKLAIVTIKKEAGHVYAQQIERILKEPLPVKFYSFEEENVKAIQEDVILLSTHINYNRVTENMSDQSEIVIPKMTIEKDHLQVINDIPEGAHAYLYNLSDEMAIDTISLLQKIGINHINFIPISSTGNMLNQIKYVITPGETAELESVDKEIIDIGIRILDLNTIIDVLARMGLSNQVDERNLQKYFDSVHPVSIGLERMIRDTSELESQFDILLNMIDDYVVVTNQIGFIYFHCNKFLTLIQPEVDNIVGSHLSDYISRFDFNEVYSKHLPRSEFIIKIDDVDIILEIRAMLLHGNQYFIHKLRKFSHSERVQANLRKKIYEMGHTSKYTFDDIKGGSDVTKKTVSIARRMSNSVSSVLIIGETGTGKELFAQAIHNASPRSDGAFVAVNCGVFNENLFESELFGYEEGSFTGARKGGKQGLFEIAHNGTLFLDEIGEMDLNLQSKLLRVIQEKRIRRVGSENIIDVDVRIVAATNRDLIERVNAGEFRKDLYYRLNVLPLSLTPLRERKDDIVILFEALQKEMGCFYSISEEAWGKLISHKWEGNVRELRNVVEYLNNLDERIILIKHLPLSINHQVQELVDLNRQVDQADHPVRVMVLILLYQAYIHHKKLGRKSITKELEKKCIYQSEQEVRAVILGLVDQGFVTSSKGRGGTRITEQGLKYLKNSQMV